ncbi:MAG: RNA-binding S4 domain-containing protein [Burkholderiales bacterium]
MRLDKWLWAARWFKTRALAQRAIASGRVLLNEERPKPAHTLKVGDALVVRIAQSVWHVQVVALSEKRGPAAQARTLYAETEASRSERERRAEQRRWGAEPTAALKGRPTKRDRRKLDALKG